jgi:hypothetical protein
MARAATSVASHIQSSAACATKRRKPGGQGGGEPAPGVVTEVTEDVEARRH